ncbi:MAG: sulfatase [Bacteroidota bacterium]
MNKYLLSLISLIFLGNTYAQDQTNIIFILIDDQRYDFLSFLDHPWIETPNIDKLAANSIYMDKAYVTTSLCSPSRASILTGQYTHMHKVLDNDTPIPEDMTTFPQVLQKGGYTTAFIGKWHMGGSDDTAREGFDHWVSFKGQGPYENPDLNINGQVSTINGYTPDILTDQAISFMANRENVSTPFFMYLSHKSIHEDFTPAPRHEGVYKEVSIPEPDPEFEQNGKPDWVKRQRKSWHGAERDYNILDYGSYQSFFQKYSECMLAVDESVGKITDYLETTGQLEETVIIYFSDNGYMMGEHGLIDKRVMYEESIRVPAFLHWPQKFPTPKRNADFFLNVDIGPTILDMAGIQVPTEMQGKSIYPRLQGQDSNWRTSFVYEYFNDPNAVQTPTMFGLRTQKYSYATYYGVWDLFELYDLENDPSQKMNLLGDINYGWGYGNFLKFVRLQQPDIYPIVERLDKELEQELAAINASRTPVWKNKRGQ